MPKEDSYIGKQIGNYRVVAKIGDGAFGSVYRGAHIFLTNRIVAIKQLHLMHLASDEERDNFLREAQILEKLKHPHILPIMDFGIDEGFPYLITEYASKGSLRDRLMGKSPQPLPLEEAVTILLQIGQALQYAHEQSIVHRDLKPGNILFNAKGEALLADFGIATKLDITVASAPIVGTPSYMAPEQFRGMVSRASDQYALGCIAYELFTGRKPFIASDMFMFMQKHSTENPVAPTQLNPNLPRYIEQAILKAMAKERKDRYADVSAFIAALHISTISVSQKPQEHIPSISSGELSPTENPVMDKCPYCGAETRPGDNFCLNCGNRLLATPSYQQASPIIGDATIPGSDNWSGPIGMPAAPMPLAPVSDDRPVVEPPAIREDTTASTVQATLDTIDNPGRFIVRDDKGEVLQEYRLEKYETVIGRAPTSDILLAKDKLTSRRHAVVRYEHDSYVLYDERSANGTFVNGQQLEELTPRTLKEGDHVGIGEHELIFRSAMSAGVEDLPTIAVPPDTAAKEVAYRPREDELVITPTDDQSLPEQIDAGTIGTRFMHTVEGQFSTAAAVPMNPPEELAPVDDLKSIALNATASSHSSPSPYPTFALDQTIAQLLEEGELHYKAKRYENALADFKRVIQMDSRNARAYGYKGNVLGKRGKYKDALAAYDAALAIDPNHASIWSAKGDVLSKLRHYGEALIAYDAALAINPNDVRTWTAKGNVLSKLKRYEEALDAYNHALELNAGDAMIWTAEGNVFFKLERYEEALVAYDHALKITLKKAFIWDAKGEVLYKLKRYEEALEAHNRALALDPYNTSISSKCDRLRDLIKHLKEKLAETQVKEKPTEAQAAGQANTRVFNAKDVSVNQLGTQQTLHDTPKRQETSELPKQRADGTGIFERFDVFLSHSHLDAAWVEKNLAMRLVDSHGFRVWLDKWILIPGEPWQPALARGIDQAHCCVVCIGEQASSGWFQQVIQRAKNRQANDPAFRVIPVLLPNARDINVDDFLELNALVDFRNSDFVRAFHVLVCGVKGIPPGPPPFERATSTRTSTTAEEMLQELERLWRDNLITDPLKEEYMRLTMEKVWFAEWTLRLKESTNG